MPKTTNSYRHRRAIKKARVFEGAEKAATAANQIAIGNELVAQISPRIPLDETKSVTDVYLLGRLKQGFFEADGLQTAISRQVPFHPGLATLSGELHRMMLAISHSCCCYPWVFPFFTAHRSPQRFVDIPLAISQAPLRSLPGGDRSRKRAVRDNPSQIQGGIHGITNACTESAKLWWNCGVRLVQRIDERAHRFSMQPAATSTTASSSGESARQVVVESDEEMAARREKIYTLSTELAELMWKDNEMREQNVTPHLKLLAVVTGVDGTISDQCYHHHFDPALKLVMTAAMGIRHGRGVKVKRKTKHLLYGNVRSETAGTEPPNLDDGEEDEDGDHDNTDF
jgi:hypothetical protein